MKRRRSFALPRLYRDSRLESAQAEGVNLIQQLIAEAENDAKERSLKLKAEQDRIVSEKGRVLKKELTPPRNI
jgi:hypothetical protein